MKLYNPRNRKNLLHFYVDSDWQAYLDISHVKEPLDEVIEQAKKEPDFILYMILHGAKEVHFYD